LSLFYFKETSLYLCKVDKNDLLHFFNTPIAKSFWPNAFPYPFYHKPDDIALMAAEYVKNLIGKSTKHDFNEQGKMFGVLVVEHQPNKLGFLMGYSGKLKDDERPEGFVPPIVDVHHKDSFYKKEEKILDVLTERIEAISVCPEFILAQKAYQQARKEFDLFIEKSRSEIKENKARRKKIRATTKEKKSETLSQLSLESKLEQIAFKKDKKYRSADLYNIEEASLSFKKEIQRLKTQRAKRSKRLQEMVFKTTSFLNYEGDEENLLSLFSGSYEGTPPSGAGECSAPRLLQSCYKMGFKPISFTEFWWGAPPKKQLRKHNTHYAACRGKCEPILNHMLKGIIVKPSPLEVPQEIKTIEVLFEDNQVLVVNKPHGLLSVPGKKVKHSVISVIKNERSVNYELYPVHRLDRQTSGVLLLAKNKKTLAALQMQFEKRSIKKEYIALLDGVLTKKTGIIALPLATDYNDTPRQLVCFEKGKYAETKYVLLGVEQGFSRVRFYPKTGRSHQLRAHSAFHEGLNMAIVGDDLYGTHNDRMYLHAEKLTFMLPLTNQELTVCSTAPF